MAVSSELMRWLRDGPDEHLATVLSNFEVNRIVDPTGKSLLHYAALVGNRNMTDYLLEQGCNPDAQDVDGVTPIMLAIQHKHNAVVQTLLAANADVAELVTRGGQNALQTAFKNDLLCTATMKKILERTRDACPSREHLLGKLLESGCQLYQAVFLKDCDLVRRMLDLGYPADSKHPTYGYTALHIAASAIDRPSVRLLLSRGADVHATDCDRQTALFYLYNYSNQPSDDKLQILRLLLDLDASPMTSTSRGFFQAGPALSRACKRGIRRLLRSDKIDFNDRDGFDEKTILHYIAMNRNPGIVEELKPYFGRYQVNALDKWGVNPLYLAAEAGNAEMLEFLLDSGSDANVRHSTFGFTPLCFAVMEEQKYNADDYQRCTELLLRHDADPQVSFSTDVDESLTIFDGVASTYDRVKCVVAHLAMLECQGVRLRELIYAKIRSRWLFEEYFKRCRRLLRRHVFGNVTLFQLLVGKLKTVAKYLRDERLVLKLRRIGCKYRAKRHYPYYFGALRKRVSSLLRRMRLEDSANNGILKIFQGRINRGSLLVEEIFNYLDNASLLNLSQL